MLSFSMPLFLAFLGVLLLKEQYENHRWLGVIVGFIGVLIMVRPGTAMFDSASLLVVLSALSPELAIIPPAFSPVRGTVALGGRTLNLQLRVVSARSRRQMT